MSTSRPIAVLTAEPLVGSCFPKPILIHRVLTRPRPHLYDVVALARHGGFEVTYTTVTIEADQSLGDALLPFWRDHLSGRPVIVDLTSGALWVARVAKDEDWSFVAIGDLYQAFGGSPPEDFEIGYPARFLGRSDSRTVEALLSAKPEMAREEAEQAVRTQTPVMLTGVQILKTLIAGIANQAIRYQTGDRKTRTELHQNITSYQTA